MGEVALYAYQSDSVRRMRNGCILCGGVGSGKSRTSLAYYWLYGGRDIDSDMGLGLRKSISRIQTSIDKPTRDCYIITTARKRDTKEWDAELANYGLSVGPAKKNCPGAYVDSWNNIQKYVEVKDAFFIFDEQRVVGKGAWVKAFLKIARQNHWVLLSATPGDTWSDYVPVFLANGFYKNRTQFEREHVVWARYTNFPKIDKYVGTKKLDRLRSDILVTMDYKRPTVTEHIDIYVPYDVVKYKHIQKDRWNDETQLPIANASEMCYLLRKATYSSSARVEKAVELAEEAGKAIIFYNYTFELELLREAFNYWNTGEWNGQKHDPVPKGNKWVYFVQYTAGAEGWNCITTDTIIFFSQNYSYKIMTQAAGRTDRLNTPYDTLYYYHLKARSPIDLAVSHAIAEKKIFNARAFTGMKG